MEYYSAVKKNEIMPFAVMCMDLEILTLSEVRACFIKKKFLVFLLLSFELPTPPPAVTSLIQSFMFHPHQSCKITFSTGDVLLICVFNLNCPPISLLAISLVSLSV